ncbi:recombination protein RecO [Campylobacter geochelonis]|uniref:recombination protein RecO n=1 Tax=Campylobacter geochelonis TaxID=1780362 RepID=UPI000770A150|nr:recombination protein RecO [Campylobacter geochelonis]CZE46913.1 putative recombination protein RecO [Campylobacter geochelonis]
MQGYILRIQKIKDEDCIVYILTNSSLVKSYRFYGARHSKITQGYKLDFELEHSMTFLPRLVNTMHLGHRWLINRDKLFLWQQFIRLFYEHLKELNDVEEIYFNVLEECALKLDKQNAKRLFIEAYSKILEAEGRLHNCDFCFLCDYEIGDKVALARGFLPSHEHCMNQNGFDKDEIEEFFKTKKSLNLSDETVNRLYNILLDGF